MVRFDPTGNAAALGTLRAAESAESAGVARWVEVWLFLMWKAYQGKPFSLPVIGSIAQQQAGKKLAERRD
jgi:hypothetical protein